MHLIQNKSLNSAEIEGINVLQSSVSFNTDWFYSVLDSKVDYIDIHIENITHCLASMYDIYRMKTVAVV